MELNAERIRYKMSEEQIKTALKCLSKPNSSPADREKCYFMWKEPSCFSCYHEVAQNALALITSQEQNIFELENRLKECENGYEGTLYLDRCKLHDAEEKIKELTEENERLRSENKTVAKRTARKFVKMLKSHDCRCDSCINEIKKEIENE